MSPTDEMLYQLQKFQLLTLFTSKDGVRKISPDYAYAWSESVFPLLAESVIWHRPYAAFFEVSKAMMEELLSFLGDRWDHKQSISFYALEEHFNVRAAGSHWDRHTLLGACRYLFLAKAFDKPFWDKVVENEKCPAEAFIIPRPFTQEEVFFQ